MIIESVDKELCKILKIFWGFWAWLKFCFSWLEGGFSCRLHEITFSTYFAIFEENYIFCYFKKVPYIFCHFVLHICLFSEENYIFWSFEKFWGRLGCRPRVYSGKFFFPPACHHFSGKGSGNQRRRRRSKKFQSQQASFSRQKWKSFFRKVDKVL